MTFPPFRALALCALLLPLLFFPKFTPDNVAVRVSTPAGTLTTTLQRPVYHTNYPNGKGCGPACTTATVNATLPR